MGSFRDALEQAGLQAFCAVSANNTQLLRTFGDVTGTTGALTLPVAIADVGYQLLCDKRPDPPLPPPFSGGQCQTLYQVSSSAVLSVSAPPHDEPVSRVDTLTGPIYGIFQKLDGANDIIYLLFRDGSGVVSEFNLYGTTRPSGKWKSYQIDSIVRVDGLPDNCGNPPVPPVLPPMPPGADTVNTTINWTDVNGNTVTNNLTISIGLAYVDVNASIQIPVKITIDGKVTISPTINLDLGGLTINLPTSGNPTGKPGLPTDRTPVNTKPVKPLPPNPLPDPPDPPDPSKSIVGAIVTVLDVPQGKATQIIQKDNPDIYAPSLGFINFHVKVGNEDFTAWTSDIPVKNIRNIIACPWEWGAIDVRGTPQPGVEFDITPIYKSSTEPPKFFS